MKKIIIFFAVFLFFSCYTSHHTRGNIAGIYIGHDAVSKHYLGFNYIIELKNNGKFKLLQRRDIYMNVGLGSWSIHGKNIYIEYDIRQLSVEDILMSGIYMKGRDTLKICSSNKIKKGNVILKKTFKIDEYISNWLQYYDTLP